MSKNIFLQIEYDGTGYFGWQVQNHPSSVVPRPSYKTVQGELEKALKRLFRKGIRVTCAGRTDKGVHAYCQCVNFELEAKIPPQNIKDALNTFLPEDIVIKKAKTVPLDFHSRFSVKSKIYQYVICNKKKFSVLRRNYAWHISKSIDLVKIDRAIPRLLGRKDFSCFAKEALKYESCVRNLMKISIKKSRGDLYFAVEADGFMRNMVRNIISFLVKIGQSKIRLKDVSKIIKGKIPYVNKPAPARGLYLYKVKY